MAKSTPKSTAALATEHEEYLTVRGIDDKAALAAGYYSAPIEEIQAIFGPTFSRSFNALAIPYFDRDHSPVPLVSEKLARSPALPKQHARYRLFPAKGSFSTQVEAPKFLQPPGTMNRFYFPPILPTTLYTDAAQPLYITEGEVKALAAALKGINCIAVGGVDSWKTKTRDAVIPMPDFDAINWVGRTVYIVYDSDASTNVNVARARWKLCLELRRRDALPRIIDLQAADMQKQGLDDVLLTYPPQDFLKLEGVHGYPILRERGITSDLALDFIQSRYMAHNRYALRAYIEPSDNTGAATIHRWVKTHYEVYDGGLLRSELGDFLDACKYIKAVKQKIKPTKKPKEAPTENADATIAQVLKDEIMPAAEEKVVEVLKPFRPTGRDLGELYEKLSIHPGTIFQSEKPTWLGITPPTFGIQQAISFANTLLDPITMTVHQHTPELFNSGALNFEYDPKAKKMPCFRELMAAQWSDDPNAILRLQEIIGLIVANDHLPQKLFIFVGAPATGKSLLLDLLTHLAGRGVSAPAQLTNLSEKFGLQGMLGKRLLICQDLRIAGREDANRTIETLLMLAANDSVEINRKGLTSLNQKMSLHIAIGTNELPTLRDNSGALLRRFCMLEFTKTVPVDKRDPRLLAKITETELPAIVNWALQGYARLCKNNYEFSVPKEDASLMALTAADSSPLSKFVTERLVLDKSANQCTFGEVYLAYLGWLMGEGSTVQLTKTMFGKQLRSAFPAIKAEVRTVKGATAQRLIGVRLRTE